MSVLNKNVFFPSFSRDRWWTIVEPSLTRYRCHGIAMPSMGICNEETQYGSESKAEWVNAFQISVSVLKKDFNWFFSEFSKFDMEFAILISGDNLN